MPVELNVTGTTLNVTGTELNVTNTTFGKNCKQASAKTSKKVTGQKENRAGTATLL